MSRVCVGLNLAQAGVESAEIPVRHLAAQLAHLALRVEQMLPREERADP